MGEQRAVASTERPVAPRPSHRAIVRRVLGLADALAATLALAAGLALGDPDGRLPQQLPWGLAAVPGLLVLLKLYGLYDRDAKRISFSTVDDVPGAFHAVLLWTLALWAVLKLAGERLVLVQAVLVVVLTLVGVLVLRAATRRLVRRLAAPERVVVVGGGTEAALLVRKMPHTRSTRSTSSATWPTRTAPASCPEASRASAGWSTCGPSAASRAPSG